MFKPDDYGAFILLWRPPVKKLTLLMVALVLALPTRAEEKQPNIIFILADDLGYADLSSYGRRDYQTPELDQLAAEGLRLTNAYASAAICSPTRTALITGRYQHRVRVGLEEPLGVADTGLDPAHLTIASRLREVGYQTSLVGKWHLGMPPSYGPLKSGYDRFFGFYPGGVDYFAHVLAHGKESARMDIPHDGLHHNDEAVQRDGYLTDILTDEAMAHIRDFAESGSPFFLSLHYNAPHWPWQGPNDVQRSRDLTSIFDMDGGNLGIYAAMMRSLDTNIARVMAELERLGIAEDTIVVFTSDNGGERFSDNWPFIGAKSELLEGGIRVPAIVRWPGRIRRGSTSDQVIASMDWMPTLLAAAGGALGPEYPLDGENLLSVLTGMAREQERTLFWRFKANDQAAVRQGRWKYLKIGDREYLFDLVADQRERANLKDREPRIFEHLKALYADWNADMLPYPQDSYSHDAEQHYSDRY